MTACKTCDQEDTLCTICRRAKALSNPRLCEHCQGWDDLTHITFCIGDELPPLEFSMFHALEFKSDFPQDPGSTDLTQLEFRPWRDLEVAGDCLVCKRLVASLRKYFPDKKPASIALWRLWPEKWHSPSSRRRGDQDTVGPWTGKCLLTFCVAWSPKNEEVKNLIEPCLVEMILSYHSWGYDLKDITFWDRRFLDAEHIKGWLSCCQNDHGEMCDGTTFTPSLPSGFRVIDVAEESVIEPQETMDNYVALSYQWATATSDPTRDLMLLRNNLKEMETPGSLSPDCLPEVIQDAVQLCRDIGQRYLWVDRLCVFQDPDDKDGSRQTQIDAMDVIYWLATVTIVASANGHGVGLPGVSSRPRPFTLRNTSWVLSMDGPHCLGFMVPPASDTINPSSWNTRGWTFQERWISRRLILFGQRHVYLSCFYCHVCETSLDMDEIFRAKTKNKHGAFFARGVRDLEESETQASENALDRYLEAVDEYTARSLGQSIDVLNAFTGVNKFLLRRLQTTSLHGLPEKYLFRSLLWARKGSPPVNIQGHVPDTIPSWSWAAGLGSVKYNWWTLNRNVKVGNLVRFWYSDGEVVSEIIEVTSWFDRFAKDIVRAQSDPEFSAWRFQEEYQHHTIYYGLPPSSMWHHCIHSPQEAICRHGISEEAMRVAKTRRGCLAFNTTVACVRLRANSTVESSTEARIIDIIDESGIAIGNLEHEIRPDDHGLSSIGCSSPRYHVIVLGACNRAKDAGADWEPRIIHENEEVYRRRGACGLYVMVVDRNGDFSSRLGIGVVCPLGWTRVQPTWETIFLV